MTVATETLPLPLRPVFFELGRNVLAGRLFLEWAYPAVLVKLRETILAGESPTNITSHISDEVGVDMHPSDMDALGFDLSDDCELRSERYEWADVMDDYRVLDRLWAWAVVGTTHPECR